MRENFGTVVCWRLKVSSVTLGVSFRFAAAVSPFRRRGLKVPTPGRRYLVNH